MAGIVGCGTRHGGFDKCQGVLITNNIAASVESCLVDTTGYSVMGYQCDNPGANLFINNVAHSIQGNGALIFRNTSDRSQLTCI